MKTIKTLILAVCLSFSTLSTHIHAEELKPGSVKITTERPRDFPGLAKISMIQAIKIAMQQFKGDPLKVELENEGGFLVFSCEVVFPDGSITEVLLDAGNGKILLIEQETTPKLRFDDENDEDDDDDEKDTQ